MKSFFIALQFLSRIHIVRQSVWSDEDFGRSVLFFPLVGLIIGALLCAVYMAVSLIFAPFYSAAMVVGFWFFLTGGLHADGFMDTADGIFSGRSQERMLEILKDSRVGSNGVLAFFFLAFFKISFLANIPVPLVYMVLLGIPAAARFGTLISIFQFPYARSQGLGMAFTQHQPSHVLVKGFLLALLPAVYGGFLYLVLLGSAMLTALLANRYIVCRLGGVTGDTYGAVLECSEVMLLGEAALLVSAVQKTVFSL
ncbi:adenosylcobinamide-GDP ribazoletransferase [uncultured Megasphaera sp.]|uniref:adenosylcobinamide-GDP ribazoletransferase n=1 Tax=uncultured Megasphaera sp. TaxID=165188 RepID=UPI002657ED26|nr:adenosylcobinamide-GDP ribazoletransferase [uncultured Megasphaera sp.]